MIHINGILNEFDEENFNENQTEVILNWYKQVDKIYFSKEDHYIILSDFDKLLIYKSKDCLDKLNVLNYRENIRIENF